MGISIFLLIILILWIGPYKIAEAIKNADWWFILLAVLIHLLAVGIRSLRWGLIIGQPREFKKNYVVKTIGLFAGNFSPMRSAGEVLNAVAGKKINNIELSEGLSAGLTERFFDALIVISLLILCAVFIPKIRLLASVGALLSLGMLILIYIFNWRENTSIWMYGKIHSLISKLPLNEKFLDNLYHRFTDGLKGMINYTKSFSNTSNLILVLFLSFLSWILECIRLYIVFLAFDQEISFLVIIIIFLLANIIGMVSALPGGMGSIELSLTGLFVLFGISGTLAGSIALIDRLASFWIVSALGIFFSAYYAHDILEEIKKYTLDLRK